MLSFQQCFSTLLKDQVSRTLGGSYTSKLCERGNANIRSMQHMGRCVRTVCHCVKSEL